MGILTWIATAVSMLGSYLNAKKIKACFYVWIAVNTFWFIHDIYIGTYSRAVLDMIQNVFCILGIINWRTKNEN